VTDPTAPDPQPPRFQADPRLLPHDDLQQLLDLLTDDGFTIVGPTVRQSAVVYDPICSVEELPRGWTDSQQPGRYRLHRGDDDRWFGFVVGPDSWKKHLFPPSATLARAEKTAEGWQFAAPEQPQPKLALLGVRACDLAAIRVQDRVLLDGPAADPVYRARREQALIVAVNCAQAASTCFCTSMGTGPHCSGGFDLAMTELADGFMIEAGTRRGAELLERLSTTAATQAQQEAARDVVQQATQQVTRWLETEGLRESLLERLDHPRWDEIAKRCTSCGNCTMVCPTCYCSSVEQVSDLDGDRVEHQRRWDSCFNIDFTFVSGGPVRGSIASRYRQWLVHKLSTWHDQFGMSGCIGCGRCITWCPERIDLTEEADAVRSAPCSTQEAK